MLNENIPMYLFHQGTNAKAYEYLGSHRDEEDENFTFFRVWAPHAVAVFVACDKNEWTGEGFELKRINEQGLWEGHFEGFKDYDAYKYLIIAQDGRKLMKCDPYAFHAETRPGTASKIYELGAFEWTDGAWLKKRRRKNIYSSPVNIYELHVGSWQRYPDGNTLSYRELADRLVPYVLDMGYTHIELLPIMEHPFDGSWGYQVTGYFAPTSRYGTPDDFMYFVNKCHENGIGVILDWVPAHFPKDSFGLYEFDGEACYEYADPNKGEHKQWGTRVFDYGRTEVQSFLMSSALFWLEVYHVDGLRVDAVASMLYLDYDMHRKLKEFSRTLNRFYKRNPTMWEIDYSWEGFSWISSDDSANSVIAFRRIDKSGDELIAVCNFTPVTREKYRIGVPEKGTYRIVLNTDSTEFGGSGTKIQKTYTSKPIPMHSFEQSISLTLPGLSVVYLKKQGKKTDNKEE